MSFNNNHPPDNATPPAQSPSTLIFIIGPIITALGLELVRWGVEELKAKYGTKKEDNE